MIATALRLTNHTSCVAALHADFSSFLPIYCPATTAPPVASAAKILMIKIIILSTNDTPETARLPKVRSDLPVPDWKTDNDFDPVFVSFSPFFSFPVPSLLYIPVFSIIYCKNVIHHLFAKKRIFYAC